jgi:hypothetical protein
MGTIMYIVRVCEIGGVWVVETFRQNFIQKF